MRIMLIALLMVMLAQGVRDARAADDVLGVLFAVGDIAECTTNPNEKFKSGEAIANLVKAEIEKARAEAQKPNLPVAVLALGDIAYDHGTPKAFECFDKHWSKLKSIMYPVPGNHEYDKKLETGEASDNGKNHAKPYFDYFTDEPGSERFRTTVKQNGDQAGFYFTNFPESAARPWRLIALNSNTNVGAQTVKLKAELKSTKDAGVRCVLAFSHAFFYSSGRHGHGHIGTGPLNAALKPEGSMAGVFHALHEGRASIHVAGHDHHYEQLGRASAKGLNKDKGKSAQAKDGVRSFVVGTGGTQLHSAAKKQKGADGTLKLANNYDRKWVFQEAYNIDGYGILKIELFDGFYKWQYVTEPSHSGTTVILKPMPENRDECNRP
jgi:acid phosphatase type 7